MTYFQKTRFSLSLAKVGLLPNPQIRVEA